ncbi:MAG: RagB/SusD family nutrient uptake outer membrane protein [Bacteroidetes bacterium]|nr:RagB/SusD family nutrient uptake outer membrane protein [Bacteroidota bacterium]MDA1120401.1 RagB/SusD family nutrient uptake outer membrane protein [Bacteroidota bacterium]
MKTINLKIITTVIISSLIGFGCSEDFLDFSPKGVIASDQLNTPENVEKLVIAAYAAQGNDNFFAPFQDLWTDGAVGSGDAHKGGGSIPDQFNIHRREIKSIQVAAGDENNELMWKNLYVLVSRINDALARLNKLTDAELTTRSQRIAEMHFLRAQTYFKLKVLYKYIVYIDENVAKTEYALKHNRELTDQEGWAWIIAEWRAAVAGLPATQAQEGRPTKGAAQLFLAKSLIYKAYVQDASHQVTSINTTELNEAISLIEGVEATGEFDLHPEFSANFECETESEIESVWAVMRSIDDGSVEGRGNASTALNSTMGQGYGCCWFNIPSLNLANAFKTDVNGLPLFNTYDDPPVILTSADVEAHNMDPRFSHTMVVLGMPWKYKADRIFDATYSRVPGIYGFNAAIKDQEQPESPCWRGTVAFFTTSRNTDQMRYASALLYWAEALIEVGRHTEILPIINRIRTRAANSTSRLVKADGSSSAPYVIGLYSASDVDTPDKAREVLRWERRLELALESHPGRFFDLVRWGIAESWMNAYYSTEVKRIAYLADAKFTAGRDEYRPIPDPEIITSQGLITQNPGF